MRLPVLCARRIGLPHCERRCARGWIWVTFCRNRTPDQARFFVLFLPYEPSTFRAARRLPYAGIPISTSRANTRLKARAGAPLPMTVMFPGRASA
jgi:hypothetical protein